LHWPWERSPSSCGPPGRAVGHLPPDKSLASSPLPGTLWVVPHGNEGMSASDSEQAEQAAFTKENPMIHLESNDGIRSADGLTRPDFRRAGGRATGLGLTELARLQLLGAAPRSSEKACIQLMLIGGPSQLETWDPKPAAPADVRGPFRPIQT